MAPGQASERLRELQAQAARDSAALNSEIEAGPSLPQQRATSFRVFSSGATADSESKPLLSKLSVVKVRPQQLARTQAAAPLCEPDCHHQVLDIV